MEEETPTLSPLEKSVIQTVQQTMHEAVLAKLTGYNSPIEGLLKNLFERKAADLNAIIEAAFDGALRTTAFKQELRDAFDKKLAKVLLGSFEGEIQRRANKLREDPAFRAKITVAIDAAIKSV